MSKDTVGVKEIRRNGEELEGFCDSMSILSHYCLSCCSLLYKDKEFLIWMTNTRV